MKNKRVIKKLIQQFSHCERSQSIELKDRKEWDEMRVTGSLSERDPGWVAVADLEKKRRQKLRCWVTGATTVQ